MGHTEILDKFKNLSPSFGKPKFTLGSRRHEISIDSILRQLLHGDSGKEMDLFQKKTPLLRISPALTKELHFTRLGFNYQSVEIVVKKVRESEAKRSPAGEQERKREVPRDSRLSFQN